METLAFIKTLLDIGSSLIPFIDKFSGSSKKKELTAWLYEIGSLVEQTAFLMKENIYPYAACGRMKILAQDFPDLFSQVLPLDRLKLLHSKLTEVIEIERMYGEYLTLEKPARDISVGKMLETSGVFLGVADVLKHK